MVKFYIPSSLLFPDVEELVEGAGTEKLRYANLLHELPQASVAREDEAFRSVRQVVNRRTYETIREATLVSFQELFRQFRGRNHNARNRPQEDLHDGPVARGQCLE